MRSLSATVTVLLLPALISGPASASGIGPGQIWSIDETGTAALTERVIVSGQNGRPAVIQWAAAPDEFTVPDPARVMGFHGKALLYLPRSVKSVMVQSQTYDGPLLSREIHEHTVHSGLAYGLIFITFAALAFVK